MFDTILSLYLKGQCYRCHLTPVANLPPVSLTNLLPYQQHHLQKFAAGVTIPVVHLHLRISPRIFENIRTDPTVIFEDLGEDDSFKKT